MAKTKIFITGSAGFIGGRLKKFLETRGVKTAGYDIRSDSKEDVRDRAYLWKSISDFKPDGIIHLAAIARVEDCYLNPGDCIATNYGGTANALEVIRKIPAQDRPWLIFSSSREVFGNPKKFPVKESDPKDPLNVYAVNKLAAEELIKDYVRNYGLKARVVRFSGVYTGLDDQLQRVIPRFLLSAFKNQPLVIEGGKQFFDFVHIGDAVLAVEKCVADMQKRQMPFDDFTLAGGNSISILDLAKLIIEITGSKSKLEIASPRSYDVIGFQNDPTKIKKVLNWQPKIDIEDGLKQCAKELRSSL